MRICYFTSWSQYLAGDASYTIDDIRTDLCDHFMYAFADMEENKLAPSDPEQEQMWVDTSGF